MIYFYKIRLILFLLPLLSVPSVVLSQHKYGFNFEQEWEWVDLLIDEQSKTFNTTEQIKYLRDEFSIEEGRLLFAKLTKLESLGELKQLPETAMLDISVNREKFSEIFRKALEKTEFKDTYAGLISSAVTLAKIRCSFGEEKKPFNDRKFFVKQVDNPKNNVSIIFDYSGAELILSLLEKGLTDTGREELRTSYSVGEMINHSKSVCLSEEELENCIKYADSKEPLIVIYRLSNPKSFMSLGTVKFYIKGYKETIETLKSEQTNIINYCLYLLSLFFPEEISFGNKVNFLFGNRSCSWRTDEDKILFDLERFGDNFELLMRYLTRELFLDEKKQTQLDVLPYIFNGEDTSVLKVMNEIYTGGISNYIAPVIQANRPSSLLEKDFHHFKMTMKDILDGKPSYVIDSMVNTGLNEQMFFYSMGTQMASTMDVRMGRKVVKNSLLLGPVFFFKTYIEVYNLGEKIRDIFRFFTDIEKKIYAMNDMIPYDMLNDMLLIKLKYINSGNLDAEVNKVFAKYKNRRDIAVLFLLAGQLYYEAGVYDKSCENFLKALPGINGKVKLSRNAGLMYMKKRAFKQSLEMFCKYVALAPDVSDAYYNRGEVEYLTGDTGMAKKDFEKAVEIDGDNAAKEYLLKIK